jgi:predicted permease
MRTLWQDLRYGLRVLRGNPTLTAVAVLTLALGIAVSTTVFSWIDGVLLHPYPGVQHSRLAVLEMVVGDGRTEDPHLSFLDYHDLRDNLKLVSDIALHMQVPVSIGEGENARRVWCELVSGNYFAMLGVKPILGRVFSPDEYSDKQDAFVAVISYRLWHAQFHGDPQVLGKTMLANRQKITVVGVAPPEFHGVTSGLAFDGWVPILRRTEMNRGNRHFEAIVGLKPGVNLAQAHAEVTAVAAQLAKLYPETNHGYGARLVPVWKAQSGVATILLAPLEILAAACGLVVLIACANVANLLLASSTARQHEFGVRLSQGAGPGRLARQLLTENLLLAALAALLSLPLVSWMGSALLLFLPPTGMPVVFEFPVNGRILGFAVLLSVVVAVAAGVPPVLHSLRVNLNDVLKQGGRTGAAGASSHRMSNLLVICEVSLALVALVGAGLFLRSFQNLRAINPGFDPHNVLLARLFLATNDYSSAQEQQFCRRLRNQLAADPGVVGVSYGGRIPLGFGLGPWSNYQVEGYVPSRGESMRLYESAVSPGYFELLRIPLLAGRDFRSSDGSGSPCVLIVNEAFARRYLRGAEPVGRRVVRDEETCTIAGMVKDSRVSSLTEAPQPFVYLSFDQRGSGLDEVPFFVRTAGDPLLAVPLMRREIAAIDPRSSGFEAMPLVEYSSAASFVTKLATTLLGVLGGIGLLLAAVGLYALMAYAVSQRTQEIGVRMALGATPGNVVGLVVRRAMLLTLAGLLIGLAATLAITHLISHMLFQVGAADPLSLGGAVVFLGLVALAASYVPARRATRIDPMAALRIQ